MSLAGVLFIVFLVLKLTGVIAWSWWYVTMPLWIGFAIAVCIWLFAGVAAGSVLGIAAIVDLFRSRKRNKKYRFNTIR